jgi:hypothetical protein
MSCNTAVLKMLNDFQIAADHRFEISFHLNIKSKDARAKTTTMSELIALLQECLTRFTIST